MNPSDFPMFHFWSLPLFPHRVIFCFLFFPFCFFSFMNRLSVTVNFFFCRGSVFRSPMSRNDFFQPNVKRAALRYVYSRRLVPSRLGLIERQFHRKYGRFVSFVKSLKRWGRGLWLGLVWIVGSVAKGGTFLRRARGWLESLKVRSTIKPTDFSSYSSSPSSSSSSYLLYFFVHSPSLFLFVFLFFFILSIART